MTIKEIRKISGLSQADFGKKYSIPLQTIKKWEANIGSPNHRSCPIYVNLLLEKAVRSDANDYKPISLSKDLANVVSTLAIEDMYLSKDFLTKLVDVADGRKSAEELRQEVINKYAG